MILNYEYTPKNIERNNDKRKINTIGNITSCGS